MSESSTGKRGAFPSIYDAAVVGAGPAGSAAKFPEELRLADLENWVKQFAATEEDTRPGRAPPKKSKGRNRG